LISKIVPRDVLKQVIDRLRDDGRTIVSTTGCFDILHIGHLRFLEEARSLGDCLVVCLNRDDSVRQLKGATRPFVPEMERAEMLSGLECVDFITLFSETTASDLLLLLQPDILAKGSDYTIDRLHEASVVHSYGGRVVFVPLTTSKSTTNLVSRIIENHEKP
jgi:rfaE bifunctional protein nucleotidyltransferase chain/domain